MCDKRDDDQGKPHFGDFRISSFRANGTGGGIGHMASLILDGEKIRRPDEDDE